MKQRLELLGLLLILLTLGLQSCKVAEPEPAQPVIYVPTQAERHANAAANISAELAAQGVEVLHYGEHMRLLIPSAQLFIKNSSNFNIVYANKALPLVAQLLTVLEVSVATINGYTSNQGSVAINQALSQRQAEKILYYLSRQGVDVRLMAARGYGSQDAIASNMTMRGQYANQRIEVKFQYVPLPISYWSRG